MHKLSVAILHYAGPPIIGGVEQTIYHHARLLTAREYRVKVIVGRGEPFHPQVSFHRLAEMDSRHPRVLAVAKALAGGTVPPDFDSLRDHLVRSLRPLLESVDIAIVHNALTLHKNMPLTAALHEMSRGQRPRLIGWCHDFAWKDDLYTPEMHPGYPWNLLRTPWPSVRYVVVSQHRRRLLADLLGLPPTEIGMIPPGVDAIEFLKLEEKSKRLVQRLHLLEAAPLLLLPARITRRKNIEMGIRIVAALKERMDNPVLVITGPPGPHNPTNIAYLNQLHRLCRELEVEDRVHFLYEQGGEQRPLRVTAAMMGDLYRLADALLFPSRREGFGIPVLEAGLARIPIFAADIPPVRESAGPCAYTFDPDGAPEPVADMIARVLKEGTIYPMRQRVLRHFTWQQIIDERVIPLLMEVASHDYSAG